MEEVETPDINVDFSNKDTNVKMDEEMYYDESTVISTIETFTIDITTIETSIALPPPSSPIPT